MKVVVAKEDLKQAKPAPVLSLIPTDEEEHSPGKEHLRSFKCRTDPADANSAKYETSLRILYGTEPVRVTIQWTKDIQRVLTALGIANATNKINLAREMLRGSAIIAFQKGINEQAEIERKAAAETAAANAAGNAAAKRAARTAELGRALTNFYTEEVLKRGLETVVENVAPTKCLQKVKRYIRREVRKPLGMKVRDFSTRLHHINNEEIPHLPPFLGDGQKFHDDELTDIILHAVPKSWIREMDRQGKDPDTMDSTAIVAFLEQIETSEEFVPAQDNSKKDKKAKGKSKGNNNNNKSDNGDGKYCMLHGRGNHKTEDCNNLKMTVKKIKGDNSGSDGKSSGSKNKSWNRKANDNKNSTRKEINAIVQKSIKEAVKKEVNAVNKKRKSDDSDNSSDEEMHNIEQELNAVDLNGFDLEELEKQINDEVSV